MSYSRVTDDFVRGLIKKPDFSGRKRTIESPKSDDTAKLSFTDDQIEVALESNPKHEPWDPSSGISTPHLRANLPQI